jgi:pSer/pThr/pTyr-binding forkhead associated (FHA) protein
MACLIVTRGEQEGKYFQLGNRTLAAGRDPSREIQLTDPKVSRRHFIVRKAEDRHAVREMNAKNPMLINGQPCGEKILDDGDEIQVGDTVLVYSVSDQPDRTDALGQFRKGDRAYREDRTISE